MDVFFGIAAHSCSFWMYSLTFSCASFRYNDAFAFSIWASTNFCTCAGLLKMFSASTTSLIATPNSSNAFLFSSMNCFFASRSLPSSFHRCDKSMIAAMGLYEFSAMALYHSSAAFLASFALPTKCETSAINADIPARIQPNTGMDLIAAPTIRKAPASPIFAAVPATADAV